MPRFYVTTPIYYVNDVPHVGHAYTTVTADAVARWHRLLGDDTFFLTGTDEHGLKVMRAADEHGLSPLEHADRTSARFREVWDLLEISYDDYIRTTEPRHARSVQAFMQAIYDNGWIYKDVYSGLYCVSCEAYYTEDELIEGVNCPIHLRPVEHLEEENWFFKLSAFTQPLLDWYEANPDVVAPSGKRNEALGIIRHGLDDISISRTSIDWGVTVPWDPDHVFYVWYDALINYATAIGYGEDPERFAQWWPAVHHLLGKDILRFHCVYWPAMLLAAGLEPPAPAQRARLLAGGRGEDVQDRAQPDLPGRPGGRLRRRRLPLPLPARRPLRTRRRLLLRGHGRPGSTPTWPTTWATCSAGWPPSWPRSAAASAPRRAPTAPSPRWPPRSTRPPPRRGRPSSPRSPSRPPGASSGRPTPISRPTSPGSSSPVPRSTP